MATYSREDYSFDPVPGQWFTYKNEASADIAFDKCPPLAAIITRKAQAYITGKTYVMKTEGKGKDKESKSEEANKFRKLWANPNPLHTQKEFKQILYTQREKYGWCVIECVKPAGYSENIDAYAMWIYSPKELEVKLTGKQFGQFEINQIIQSITLVKDGKRRELNLNDLIFIRDFTPSSVSSVFPVSKLKACELPINNIIGAYESRFNIMNSRGPQFVISSNRSDQNGRHPMLPAEKDDLQNSFKRGYGTRNGQNNAIITKAPIDLKTVGFATKEMQLIEEVQESTTALCNALGIAPELLGSEQAKYTNMSEAGKALFNNTIKPDANAIAEQVQRGFFKKDSGLRIDEDYSENPEMQEDEKEKAESRFKRDQAYLMEFKAGLITLNMWLVANGEDALPDGDVYAYDFWRLHPELATTNPNTNGSEQNDTGRESETP